MTTPKLPSTERYCENCSAMATHLLYRGEGDFMRENIVPDSLIWLCRRCFRDAMELIDTTGKTIHIGAPND